MLRKMFGIDSNKVTSYRYAMRICLSFRTQLAEIHRHTWVVAGSAGCRGGELELELPMMSVVQTRILPTEDDCDPDVLQAITSLGCFKDRKKLIQELLNPK